MIESYVFLAILSTILFGFSSILVKLLIPKIGGPFQFLMTQLILGMIVLSALIPLIPQFSGNYDLLFMGSNSFYLLLAGIFGIFGYISLIIGLEVGNASVGGVVLSSRVFSSVPLAFFIVGEIYEIEVYLFIIVAFIGAITVSWDEKIKFNDFIHLRADGLRWFLSASILWSISNLMIRQLNNTFPVLTFLFIRQIIFLVIALPIYLIARSFYELEPINMDIKYLLEVLIYVILIITAQMGFVYAIGKSLTISEAIGTFEGSVTLLASMLFAKYYDNDILDEPLDSKTISIRIVGAVLAIIGTLGVVISIS